MTRARHKQPTFEVAFVVTLDTGDVVMGDWGEATEEQLDSIQQALEDFRSLAHFSVIRDGVQVFINPLKILYVEVLTRDLEESQSSSEESDAQPATLARRPPLR